MPADDVKIAAREYAAAALNRLTNDWQTTTLSADSVSRMDLPTLRARSRELFKNNAFAKKYGGLVRSNVLGESGMMLKSQARTKSNDEDETAPIDKDAARRIEARFWEWGKRGNCTVCGRFSWSQVQRISMESIPRDGEVLIRIVSPWPNKFGFALQLIESDLLDIEYNEQLPDGREIRMGVEIDQWGRPVAYNLFRRNPNDLYFNAGIYGGKDRVRIPASEILHPYLISRPGQTRGTPWLATAMLPMKNLGAYSEAEVVAARVAACKMAFMKTVGDAEYAGDKNASGKIMDAEPGSIEKIEAGLELQTLDWQHPNSQFGAFTKAQLREIAAGLEVCYFNLASDHEGVNFSSSRVGLDDERASWRLLQEWFSEEVCSPVFERWLMAQLMSGGLGYSVAEEPRLCEHTFHGRRWQWVDPVSEVKAKIAMINAGLTSPTRELAAMNIDRDELVAELKADKEAFDAAGLTLPEIFGGAMKAAAAPAKADEEGPEEPEEPEDTEEAPDRKRFDTINGRH